MKFIKIAVIIMLNLYAVFLISILFSSTIANIAPLFLIDNLILFSFLHIIVSLIAVIILDKNSTLGFFGILFITLFISIQCCLIIYNLFSIEAEGLDFSTTPLNKERKVMQNFIYAKLNTDEIKILENTESSSNFAKSDLDESLHKVAFICKKYPYDRVCDDYVSYLIQKYKDIAHHLILKQRKKEKSSDDFFNKFTKEKNNENN
ncbi:hypothetical protein DMB95_08940 [Campylobacter sp. MIT 12-8780]|uniref:hypothetical protein n=1 Tax=unclassified Campylobacter TaxID=2593542 RepID=UPI00115CDACA|nr:MULTISPECIES: hypothetical protein [unclassified Campylobacter]NDJ27922.1 hypothetical protein [Campylobacter sp. MIT 19-121]TQR40145.1 hypothetical protein DMB95_08940 [Campylobacter sp. MIT 12-8780]